MSKHGLLRMNSWVHGMLRSEGGHEGHFRYSTEGQSLAEYIKVIEEKHCKGCEVLWIAKGFTPIDSENWPNWVLTEEEMVPGFKPSDAGRYVAIREDSNATGKRLGIIIEVLDEEDARVWHPNLNREEGGRGTARIVNINKVIAFGDWVEIDYPAEFLQMIYRL